VYVLEGTPLLKIDPRQYALYVARLESEAQKAQVELNRLELQSHNTRELIRIREIELSLKNRELEKSEELYERNAISEGERDRRKTEALVTELALQQVQNEYSLLPNQREQLEKQLDIARAQWASAKLDLEKTEIVAPISGLIVEDPVEERQFVPVGTRLVTIDDTSSVEVKCHLRLEQLNWLWNSADAQPRSGARSGQPYFEVPPADATVTYQLSGQSYTWAGHLSRYEGTGVDERTRTVPCRILVSEPRRVDAADGPRTLVRGMYVKVHLHVTPKTPLLRIPNEALQPNGVVWTVDEGLLRIHEVHVAQVVPDAVWIHDEHQQLAAGDSLVISPLAGAFDGMQVRESNSP